MPFYYIDNINKVFPFVQSAYNFALTRAVPTEGDALKSLPDISPFFNSASEWNTLVYNQGKSLTGLFASVQQLENQANGLLTGATNRWSFLKAGIRRLTEKTNSLQSQSRLPADTVITISPSSTAWLETNPSFYSKFGMAARHEAAGEFTLPTTGDFSAIRSRAGTLVRPTIEKSLLAPHEFKGVLNDIVDGSDYTYHYIKFGSLDLVQANSDDIGWLPENYSAGSCVLLTLNLERPISFTELKLNPLAELPQILYGVHWTPLGVRSFIESDTFTTGSSNWDLTDATFSSTSGLNFGPGITLSYEETLHDNFSPVYVTRAFARDSAYANSMVEVFTLPGSGYTEDNRLQVNIRAKSTGCKLGCRVNWQDATGDVIQQELDEQATAGYFNTYAFVFYPPASAASGTIDIGLLSDQNNQSITVDKVTAYLGQQQWLPSTDLISDTNISLPLRINASRVSLSLGQINPGRHGIGKRAMPYYDPYPEIPVASPLTHFKPPAYLYSFGLREVDLINKEYLPRAAVFTKPLNVDFEIRRFWLDMRAEFLSSANIRCVFYPFANDLTKLVNITPYYLPDSSFNNKTLIPTEGEIFEIITTEERDNNFVLNDTTTNKIVIDPVSIDETYEGTDPYGSLQLKFPVHLRRVRLAQIESFLNQYGPVDSKFDPNARTVFGLLNDTYEWGLAQQAPSYNLAMSPASALTATGGYMPMEVTVSTLQWTAHPDTTGQPTAFQIQTASGEYLEPISDNTVVTQIKNSTISFTEWLVSTKVSSLAALDLPGYNGAIPFINPFLKTNNSLKECIDANPSQVNFNTLQSWYDYLKANNRLANSNTVSTSQTTTRTENRSYQAKNKDIISGPAGTFIRVYWVTEEGDTVPVSPSSYEVLPQQGIITVFSLPPEADANLYADYTYRKVNTYGVIPGSTVVESALLGQSGYVTRNVTDYTYGAPIKFKPFQPNPLEPDYYPVIEYFVSGDSKIVFSTSFFKYGPLQAKIQVRYETLSIQPRIATYFIRPSSPSSTPKFRGLNIGLGTSKHSFN